MKRVVVTGLLLIGAMLAAPVLHAVAPSLSLAEVAEAAVSVKGYYRKNGTYVAPHYRSNPDGNPYNNWSYPGNTNPYTGKTATGNADTYLKNYYKNSNTYTPTYSLPASLNNIDATPTWKYCGLFQSYNSLTDQCECYSGYYMVNGQCKSQRQICTDKYGYGAESAIGGGCQCSYGYRLNHAGTKCITRDSYCKEIDVMAGWDYLEDSCTCSYGWKAVNNTCIPK